MLDRGKSRLAILEIRTKRPRIETPIGALKDWDPSVRLGAINSLKWLKDTQAVEPLLSLLSDREVAVRWAAIHTLGLLNDRRAVEPLIALLSDADILNRWAVALALGRLRAREALNPLVAALADENSLVRMMARVALGYLKDPDVLSSLRALLTDSDPMVGRAARGALDRASLIPTKPEAGIREDAGFRVKPGMTKEKGLISLGIDEIEAASDVGTSVRARSKREKKAAPRAASTDAWFWRLLFFAIAVLIGLAVHDYWTEKPPTLFERLLTQSISPRSKLEDTIPSLLERGYPCDEILRAIADVRWFVRERLLTVPTEEVGSVVALRLAEERTKRLREAEKYPHVHHGGLAWLRLRKRLFGYPQYPAPGRCP